jgi:hypothetical protein
LVLGLRLTALTDTGPAAAARVNIALLSLGATATASSADGSYPPSQGINGNNADQWWAGGGSVVGQWLKVTLPSPALIMAFRVIGSQVGYQPDVWAIQSSPDNSTWTTQYTSPGGAWEGYLYDSGIITLATATTAQYWRAIGISGSATGGWAIYSFELWQGASAPPPVDAAANLFATADMIAAANAIRGGDIAFAGLGAFTSDLYRAGVGAVSLSASATFGPLVSQSQVTGIALFVATSELDPFEAAMQRGGRANLGVEADIAPGLLLGRIDYYGQSAMQTTVDLEAIGGNEWHGLVDLTADTDLVADSHLGTVGLNPPGFVSALLSVDGAGVIGGLTDDGWRVSIDMFAASDGIYFGHLTEGFVRASMDITRSSVYKPFLAEEMVAEAMLLTIAYDVNNARVDMDATAVMAPVDAPVQIGSWTDLFVSIDLAMTDFSTIRTGLVGQRLPNDADVQIGLTAEAYLDLVLDGVVGGRPYDLRASAKMTVAGAILGDLQVFGDATFQGHGVAHFAAIRMLPGELNIPALSVMIATGTTLVPGAIVLEGLGVLISEGATLVGGALEIGAQSDLTLHPSMIHPGELIIPSQADLEANGGFMAAFTGDVQFDAFSDFTASMYRTHFGAIDIGADFTAEFSGTFIRGAGVDFVGVFSMDANGLGSTLIVVDVISSRARMPVPTAYGGTMTGLAVRTRDGVAGSLRGRSSDTVFS